MRTYAALLCTALTPVSWSAGPAPGGERAAFYLEGPPGAVLTDKLSVSNPDTRPHDVALRATGSWISFTRQRVTVPARTRADVPFTVSVPPGAGPGDHPAAVVADGDGRRVSVPVAVRVSGSALPALAVEHVRVSGTGDGAVIRYALVNRGNTVLTPRLTIHAEGLFGEVLRRVPDGVPAELAPGRSVRLSQPWPGAPVLDRVTVRVTAEAPGAQEVSASGAYTPLPWLWPVLGGLGLTGAVFGVRRWRRRARGTTA
ncbi:hypothetical protein AB0K09_04750 [Streptomyces sp. NPDC049577]|uniref:COG1470 family protein n=1 Tax=Streptomyces sp. NPDC049577 TaxID=3155153 RepID=UPI00341AF455